MSIQMPATSDKLLKIKATFPHILAVVFQQKFYLYACPEPCQDNFKNILVRKPADSDADALSRTGKVFTNDVRETLKMGSQHE